MTLSLIVAMTDERVIGKDNQMPWHLPEDLKRFKKITMGKPIIMGRKTYDSIGRPLPGRRNIVLSRNPELKIDGVEVVDSIDTALALCDDDSEAFVIGGEQIFKEAMTKADKLYLTLIHREFVGDTWFPEINLEEHFETIEKKAHHHDGDEPFDYTYLTLVKRA